MRLQSNNFHFCKHLKGLKKKGFCTLNLAHFGALVACFAFVVVGTRGDEFNLRRSSGLTTESTC